MRRYETYSSNEISDLNNKVDKAISNPEEFSQEYINGLINKVVDLGISFHEYEHGDNIKWIYSLQATTS